MSSTTLKVLALVTLLLAVALGFAAYRMSQNMTRTVVQVPGDTPAQPESQSMAVVAVKPINAHEAITAEHVKRVAVSVLPAEYFDTTEEVVQRQPMVDVEVGTTLTPRLFKGANPLSAAIPAGHRAMSLEIDDVIAVGGFVQPGDTVDALLYIRSKSKEVADSQARLLLEETMVLAYEERLLPESKDSDEAESARPQTRQRRQRTVVLAVPEDETVRVMLGASIGDIRLALHASQAQSEAQPPRPAEVEDLTLASEQASNEAVKDQPAAKPITLRELGAIKSKRSKTTYTPSPVYVYRGNEVQTVRH